MSYTKRGGTEFLGNWKIGDTEYSLLEQVKPLLDAGVTDGVVKSVNGVEPDANGNVEVLATDRVLLQRPISDLALFPVVYASEDGSFNEAQVIDPLNNASDRTYLKVFNGELWMEFPESGLGTLFDLKEVAVDVSKFSELAQPYYIKYCWADSEGTESNYRALEYPASTTVAIKSGTVNSVNGIQPDSNGNVEITLTDSVDESRLLPKDATDGNIAVYDEDAGNWKATLGIKTVNEVEPDTNGNIAIDIGVQAVASISPDIEGNVDGSELRSVLGAITRVNGITPDEDGSIELEIPEVDNSRLLPQDASTGDLAIYDEGSKQWQTIASEQFGTVKSVNSIAPDDNGNVTIDATGTVKSVAGVDPDDAGNIDGDSLASALGMVKSVNGITPDADGNVKITTDSSSGTSINHLVIQRPVSDLALYPYVEASESPDYDNSLEIDLYDDYDGNASYCKVFNGDSWMDIPKSGLGTPFDSMEVEIELSKFEGLSQPYYLRYGWVTSDGAYSNYKGLMFPSVSCVSNSSSNNSSSNSGWIELVDSSALTLNSSLGEQQKVTLSQNCTITAPTLSSSNPTLLLQITSFTSISVYVGSSTIVSNWVGTMHIRWFWDGSTTRRYPAIQLEE